MVRAERASVDSGQVLCARGALVAAAALSGIVHHCVERADLRKCGGKWKRLPASCRSIEKLCFAGRWQVEVPCAFTLGIGRFARWGIHAGGSVSHGSSGAGVRFAAWNRRGGGNAGGLFLELLSHAWPCV